MNNSWQNDFLSFKLFKFILKGKNGSSQNIIRFFNYLLTLSSNHLVRLWFAAAIDKPIFLLNWPSSPQLFLFRPIFPTNTSNNFCYTFQGRHKLRSRSWECETKKRDSKTLFGFEKNVSKTLRKNWSKGGPTTAWLRSTSKGKSTYGGSHEMRILYPAHDRGSNSKVKTK